MKTRALGTCVILAVSMISVATMASETKKTMDEGSTTNSPERARWENLVPKQFQDRPAFQFVEDDPHLPRVLLVGDSISIGYTVTVREMLEGKANLHRVPENAGDTSRGLEKLHIWFGDGEWDVIHFNWGLHDLKRMKDGKLDSSGEQVTSPEQYRENLERLVQRLKKTGAKLIWASTTPVPEGAGGRTKGDEVKYNEIAAGVMKKHGVPTDDLYAFAIERLDEIQLPQNVHFTEEGSEALGKKVVESIQAVLEGNRQGSR
jgi:acyl-CoA thioesterase-1